ncbi:MAG: hypothetical protein P4M11_10725 [Candidatus Pacebacteria bacterium]|nr:hypothetical protein [Candidatus Paceibacterota bacterium]
MSVLALILTRLKEQDLESGRYGNDNEGLKRLLKLLGQVSDSTAETKSLLVKFFCKYNTRADWEYVLSEDPHIS